MKKIKSDTIFVGEGECRVDMTGEIMIADFEHICLN